MSQMERYRGRLIEVYDHIPTIEMKVAQAVKDNHAPLKPDYYVVDVHPQIFSIGEDKYLIFRDKLYEFIELTEFDDDEDYCRMEKVDDEYVFETQFYNGYEDLSTMLAAKIKRLERDDA